MFQQIVLVDDTGLRPWAIEELQKLSLKPVISYPDGPKSQDELIQRIASTDCVFVSWNTSLDADVLRKARHLKYIGMCCSLYSKEAANVDISYAEAHNIAVTGIRDYGDEGLVEYIIAELIRLLKGIGEKRWRKEPVELTQRKVGIIGMGKTGKMLADRLQAFGARVRYYSRSRKPEAEQEGIQYMNLKELLNWSEIISLHLPKNTIALKEEEFNTLGAGKILINTSLGLTLEKTAFEEWIANEGNYAIFDGDGIGRHKSAFDRYPNIISTEIVSGWTLEARDRLSNKVLENVNQFVKRQGG